MELRRLRLLAELRRRETIANVALALDFSPSSVSVQLSELEREAGVALLVRVGRNVQLTAAGHRLADHAEQALSIDEEVRAELAALQNHDVAGRVRVSFVQTAALALLPTAMATLARTAPDLRIELVHRETVPGLEDVRARALDLSLGIDYDPVPPPTHHDIHRIDLIEEDVMLAVPSRSPLSRQHAVPLVELKDSIWAAGPAGGGHSSVIEYLCSRVGRFNPDIRHRTDDALILRALVSSGHAVTLLPALIGTATPHVSLRPVDQVQLRRTIFTAVRSSSQHLPAVQAVRAALLESAQHAASGRADVRMPSRSAARQ
jgi:DNA-binding transcriptional LysR family regulator